MKGAKLFLLVSLSVLLSACSTNYKALPKDYNGRVLGVGLLYNDSHIMRGDYVSAARLVPSSAVVPVVAIRLFSEPDSTDEVVDFTQQRGSAIYESLKGFDFNAHVDAPMVKTIENAPWLDVKFVNSNRGSSRVAQKFKGYDVDGTINVGQYFLILDDRSFKSVLHFEIWDKKNKGGGAVYRLVIEEPYSIPENKKGLKWEDDNAALVKDAIIYTSKRAHERLGRHLAKPHSYRIQKTPH